MVVWLWLLNFSHVVNIQRGRAMIKLYKHKNIYIQQWFNKYSFRVDNGQWYEYPSLEKAKKAIGALKHV